jgi:hypothetical protein
MSEATCFTQSFKYVAPPRAFILRIN